MRTVVSVGLLLFILPTTATAQPGGDVYAPAGGHFSTRFPGTPKETTQSTKTDLGTLSVFTAAYATADGHGYLVSYTDYPAGTVKPGDHRGMYDAVRKGIEGKKGALVAEKEIAVGPDKLAGREILIDKGKTQTRFRVVIRDHRLYQIAVIGTGEFVTGKDATAFLDSFELGK